MNTLESIFAAKLLNVKAIKLQPTNPFTWASGWKSPFYCDNRKTLSFPDLRTFVKMANLIEGELQPGTKVVVVEDLISTGGSSLKAVEALRAAGYEVVGMVASYTYGFPVAEQAFADADVKLITLTNYEAVVAEALRTGYIADDQVPMLHEWRKDPAHWNA